ncbi:MAG: hypothetical protein WC877_03315 [Dehalococcoidales bacterium]|jgi:hypothetical protein|nr:hypothetical protein [Candidatus Neomarinimicrobiota bacterium]
MNHNHHNAVFKADKAIKWSEAGFWLTLSLVVILFLVLKFSSCATDSYVLSMAAQVPPWAAEKTSSAKAERQYFFLAGADRKAVHAVPPSNFYHEEHEGNQTRINTD